VVRLTFRSAWTSTYATLWVSDDPHKLTLTLTRIPLPPLPPSRAWEGTRRKSGAVGGKRVIGQRNWGACVVRGR
jgi:hypothetical protein